MGTALDALRVPGARRLLPAAVALGTAQGMAGVVFPLLLLEAGFRVSAMGSLAAAASLAALVAALPAGRWCDRRGPRGAVLWGGLGAAAGVAGSALWPVPAALWAFQLAVAVLGTAVWVGVPPLVSQQVAPPHRDPAFGALWAAVTAAGALGSLLGGLLARAASAVLGEGSSLNAYRAVLLAAAALGGLALVPVARLPAGPGGSGELLAAGSALPRHRAAPRPPGPESPSGYLPGPVRWLLPAFLEGAGAGMALSLLSVYLVQRFRVDAFQLGLTGTGTSLAVVLAGVLAPAAAARVGRVRAMAGALVLSLPFLAAAARAPRWEVAAAAFALRALVANLSPPLRLAWLMEAFPDRRAEAHAVFSAAWGTGWAAGAQIAGLLGERGLWMAFFALSGTMYALAAALAWRWWLPLDRPEGA